MTAAFYDDAFFPIDRRIGDEGRVFRSPSLHWIPVGWAFPRWLWESALDTAARYATSERCSAARSSTISDETSYLDAARRRDLGRPYSTQASVAKLAATDAAMKVTTDAVQVLGGYGYTRDYRVERYVREVKITQTSTAPTRFSAL